MSSKRLDVLFHKNTSNFDDYRAPNLAFCFVARFHFFSVCSCWRTASNILSV